ncbi:MAG: MFS transporter [Syntrophobacteraceae bacterium]|jgi:predicted MFS family arabinose efflux permease|nr:MFS transporter [Syntrophobacteraceae bacterium]
MLYTPRFMAMAFANLAAISSYSCFFLFPLFILDRGGSPSDVGILMGAFTLSSVLCRPWIASMIDRIGRKRSFTLGSVIMTLLPLTYLLPEGSLKDMYAFLLLVRVAHGAGIALCFTAAFTYAADIIPPERFSEGIGMFGISGLTGMALGPAVCELMISHLGFLALFATASVMGLLSFLVHLPLPETFRASSASPAISFLAVLRGDRLLLVGALSLLFGFGLAASGTFLPPFATERGISILSSYYITYSGTAVSTRLLGGRLSDRIGVDRIIPCAFLLLCAGLGVMIHLSGSMVLVLAGFLMGCGHGFLYPALNTLAVKDESPGNRGKATAVFSGSIDAGLFVGSTALGYVAEWSGYPVVFAMAGAGCLLGGAIFWLSRPRAGVSGSV